MLVSGPADATSNPPGALVFPAPAQAERRADAETCLAQAISYEAGHEPEAGREAVAAVVLNRLRSPAYPKTVCGVVFQGAERRTGCQFTFTCDGSLMRRQSAAVWSDALKIAQLALDGQIASPIGDATHYHAVYVNPAWAAQLTRVVRIGAHIFYAVRTHEPVLLAGVRSPTFRRADKPVTSIFSPWGVAVTELRPVGGAVAIRAEELTSDVVTPLPGSGPAGPLNP